MQLNNLLKTNKGKIRVGRGIGTGKGEGGCMLHSSHYDFNDDDSDEFGFSVHYTPKFFSRTPDDPLFQGYNTTYYGDSDL